MKKAGLLVVFFLMAIFFCPLVQASDDITAINVEISPSVVPNDGTRTVKIVWNITRPGPDILLEDSADYTKLTIKNSSGTPVFSEHFPIDSRKKIVNASYPYDVSECLSEGVYDVIFYHPPIPNDAYEKNVTDHFRVRDTCKKLSIFKFNDSDKNGRSNPGEEGLEGWEFEIRQDGRLVDTCVTDPNGYCVSRLPVGTYTITERLKSGWEATTPNPVVLDVNAEETTNVEFGNHYSPHGKLSIFKFNDSDQNGRRDPGEGGLEGWKFEIKQDGRLVDTCVTDPNGYCNRSLPEGKYTITERLKSDWEATTPNPVVLDVNAGQKTNVEFGNHYISGNLSIFKFNDLNNNSRRDLGEEGLEGWTFDIRQDDRLVDTCVTDPNGYCNRSLPEGTYTITERLKSDWEATTPNPVVIDVNAGQTTNVEFGNYLDGTLSIFKFNDLNNNSRREPGEEGLKGWEFEIRQDGRLVDTCVTDPNGYCNRSLPEGTYTITERLKSGGWEATTPNPVVLDVKAGQKTNVEFGNHYISGNLSIFKFNDRNNNSRKDPGEGGLEDGWEFEIKQDGRLVDTCVTDPNGYCNRSLKKGTYKITERLKSGWEATTPNPVVIDVNAGQTTNVEFGNRNRYGNLSIFKFNDRNNNSIKDPDEEGIANWSFEIRQEWQLVDTCVTDPNGYCVRKLLEGRYKITEQQSRCWVSTTPESLEIEVRAGQTTEVEFGNYAIGNLTIQKFYDDNRNKVQEYGEEGLPNWTFTITFPDGNSKRITTDANGTYTLINVPIGRYTIIEEAMTCRWTNSTSTTQDAEVTACQETIASFGNYIADCSIPPGCPWFNEDENLNVSKSVVPCVCNITLLREGESTSKEGEPEVSVYLRVCVDKRHIKDGIAVENITVVETLYNHFTVVEDSFSEQPRAIKRNPDGTTTMVWDIPSLCCEEWLVSFNATPEYALPIDVTDTSEQVTSKVIYEYPIETGMRELSIPEGKLKFRFIVPPAPLHPICYVLGGLLVISILIEIPLEWKRRKKEKPKEKEKE